MMKRIGFFLGAMFVVSVAGMTCCSGEALADPIQSVDGPQFGHEALSCFFPAGRFSSMAETNVYTNNLGLSTRNGWIRFHVVGGSSLFTIVFVIQTKTEHGETWQRMAVISDTAPGPISSCSLRDWHAVP